MNITPLLTGTDSKSRRQLLALHAFAEKHIQREGTSTQGPHGAEIATILAEATADADVIGVSLLFGLHAHPEYERIVHSAPMTKRQKMLMQHLHERQTSADNGNATLRQTVKAIAADAELLTLRLAQRLAEIRHMDSLPPDKQRALAQETLYVHTSLASRLGIYRWRSEMEERCFPVVHSRIATQLRRKFEESRKKDTACLRHATSFIGRKLRKAGIKHDIQSRIKGLYSTYQKMMSAQETFHELHDRLALRVIVDTVEECYKALGIIHGYMHPITGTLKDYIGTPKQNGYQSIHTVVYPLPGVTEQKMEIQIRTRQMHEECEYGPAVHHGYKHGTYARPPRMSTGQLLETLRAAGQSRHSPREFEQTLATYYREHHIVVFDGDNQLYHLLKPVTALDFLCFAYGKRCAQAKAVRINGVRKVLGTTLRDGDIVEAAFDRRLLLRKEWLKHCRHRVTKDLISSLLRS